ncbi:MAG: UDP-3-O-(3-hydroxymyristoyl)glucosamine N-acyltransferase [Paludibacteraceae bacterium]|nr:UDP-3-O-(3-hydroxymyristoyl)glucosamine N-acyltransferase [Paludibacteraceae bacterium]
MQFTAQQIAAFVSGEIIGNASVEVHDVSPIEQGRAGTLSYVTDHRFAAALSDTEASVVLLTRELYDAAQTYRPTLILVDNARQAIGQLLQGVAEFLRPRKRGIEQPAFVAEGTAVPEDAYIGAFAYVGKGVKIGKGVQIYPQSYIGDYTTIGDNTIVYAGVKVYDHCTIGRDCILHSGCVIGADGFGFEPDAQGINHKIPQIGTVVIEDDVEIGANTTIDRAMMGETRVSRNVKVDNLVQVAHNVHVGDSTFLCSQVGIAGSTSIGKHCILAGQVGVANRLNIADNVVLGAQAGVAGSLSKAGSYQGTPAIDAMNWRRSSVVFKNLPELKRTVDELTKQSKQD